MKAWKTELSQVLRRKVRVRITRRKRGAFVVHIPGALTPQGWDYHKRFPNKRQAMATLHALLRCMNELTVEVRSVKGGAK